MAVATQEKTPGRTPETVEAFSAKVGALTEVVMEAQDVLRALARAPEEEKSTLEARLEELLGQVAASKEQTSQAERAPAVADGFGMSRAVPDAFGAKSVAAPEAGQSAAPESVKSEVPSEPEPSPEEVWQEVQARVNAATKEIPEQGTPAVAAEFAEAPETIDLSPEAVRAAAAQMPELSDLSLEEREAVVAAFLEGVEVADAPSVPAETAEVSTPAAMSGVANDNPEPATAPAPETETGKQEVATEAPVQTTDTAQEEEQVAGSGASGWSHYVTDAEKKPAVNDSSAESAAHAAA